MDLALVNSILFFLSVMTKTLKSVFLNYNKLQHWLMKFSQVSKLYQINQHGINSCMEILIRTDSYCEILACCYFFSHP